jgi:HEAT repeat protein
MLLVFGMSKSPPKITLPPGSIAAVLGALPVESQPTAAFREAACATLRSSRARGRIECEALGRSFEDETSSDRRLLILDLLARAGTPDAQTMMCDLVALPDARRDASIYASFVQRLGFVERPDPATLAFLVRVYEDARGMSSEVRSACAYALGAAAGRAHVWGEDAPGAAATFRASAVLRADLLVAEAAVDKSALLAALGNAGLERDVPLILGFVNDGDDRVRVAAVLALRKMHTPEAKGWLISAIASSLAESALSALFEQALTNAELVLLADLVVAGHTALALDARILRLILTQRLASPTSGGVVEQAVQLLQHRIDAQELKITWDDDESAPPPTRRSLSLESGEYARYAALAKRKSTPPAPAESEVHPVGGRESSSVIIPSGRPITPLAVIR